MKQLLNYLTDKRILILGFGKEGKSTFQFLRKHAPELQIGIADKNIEAVNEVPRNEMIKISTGNNYLAAVYDYDLIIKSPGVSLKGIRRNKPIGEITSQTDLFLRFCSQQVVGITGTKGKSTTAALIYRILQSALRDVVLVGNIGIPPFDKWENLTTNTIVVYELSSYQLEYIQKSPQIAVLLNLFQEHLDHHGSQEAYWQAKLNILLHQQAGDHFIYHADDPVSNRYIPETALASQLYTFSKSPISANGCSIINDQIYFHHDGKSEMIYSLSEARYLKGDHNVLNMMAAVTVSKILAVENSLIRQEFQNFRGLPHRLEYVGKYNGILFYNDSISTIPEATIAAVKALMDVETLIVGGLDRGVSFYKLCIYLYSSSVRNIILLPDTGHKIWETIQQIAGDKNCRLRPFPVETLAQAVTTAKVETHPGSICLLSPAAASYGNFRNFEERGELFVKLVRNDGD